MMGLLFVESLTCQELFRCKLCGVDIAYADDAMSPIFHGRSGSAWVVARVVNIILRQNENQHLLTGLCDIKDAHCSTCQQLIGWKFNQRLCCPAYLVALLACWYWHNVRMDPCQFSLVLEVL